MGFYIIILKKKIDFSHLHITLSLDNGDAITIYEHGGTNDENTKNT